MYIDRRAGHRSPGSGPDGSDRLRLPGAARQPFMVKDCALITLATGLRAQNLRELRDRIRHGPLASIEYHFFSSQLRPTFDDPEFRNDFATWARHGLNDRRLAERLAVLDPLQYPDLEALRSAILDVLEERQSENEQASWAPARREFVLLTAQTVVFDTGHRAATPQELGRLVPRLSTGSIYYHFVEARRRLPDGRDDFREWIDGDERYRDLSLRLARLNYYFLSLSELRQRLAEVFAQGLGIAPA